MSEEQSTSKSLIQKEPNHYLGDMILCPNCEGTYVHHSDVIVYDRSEDAEEGLQVSVQGKEVNINREIEGCPSPRRHGLSIKVWCEHCHYKSVIHIVQHKGQTFVDTEVKEKMDMEEGI
jgi:hypothetical protein